MSSEAVLRVVNNDPIIRVDRSVKIERPEWVKDFLRPDLQNTGPRSYHGPSTNLWLHPRQRRGVIQVNELYQGFDRIGRLEYALGIHDGLEIQRRGSSFFKLCFGPDTRMIMLWRSAVEDIDAATASERTKLKHYSVPYILDYGSIMFNWLRFSDFVDGYQPGAFFSPVL